MKDQRRFLLLSLASIFVFAGCDSRAPESEPLVEPELRSDGFAPVAEHLHLGGGGYLFLDTAGFAESFAEKIESFIADLPQEALTEMSGAAGVGTGPALAMLKNFPFKAVMEDLGLTSVEAFGTSYYRKRDDDYRRSSFIHMPDGAAGLFALGGGDNQAFDAIEYAPADTDVFLSTDFDARRFHGIVENIAVRILGETGRKQLNSTLGRPIPGATGAGSPTVKNLVEQFPTRHNVILRLGEAKEVPDLPVAAPAVSAVVLLENRRGSAIDALESRLRKAGGLTQTKEIEGVTVYYTENESELPFLERPAVAIDRENERYFFTNKLSFLEECFAAGGALAESEEYRGAVAELPEEGTSLLYLSGKLYTEWASFRQRILREEPLAGFFFGAYSFYFPFLMAEARDSGTARVTTHLPDGILTRSNWGSASLAGSTMGANQQQAAMAVGLVAAMAIPAFEKVRETSREKTITNNLRMLASGADQYFLENGVTEVRTEELLGEDGYFRSFEPIAGESYPERISTEMDALTATLPDGDTISIPF